MICCFKLAPFLKFSDPELFMQRSPLPSLNESVSSKLNANCVPFMSFFFRTSKTELNSENVTFRFSGWKEFRKRRQRRHCQQRISRPQSGDQSCKSTAFLKYGCKFRHLLLPRCSKRVAFRIASSPARARFSLDSLCWRQFSILRSFDVSAWLCSRQDHAKTSSVLVWFHFFWQTRPVPLFGACSLAPCKECSTSTSFAPGRHLRSQQWSTPSGRVLRLTPTVVWLLRRFLTLIGS